MENLVFGLRPVIEAIEAGKEIEKLYIRKGAEGQLMNDLNDLCYRSHLRYQEVPVEKASTQATRKMIAGRKSFRASAFFKRFSTNTSEPSNAVVRVSVDYTSGDILVEYADGYKMVQRYTPPKKKSAVRHRPAIKKEGD